MERCVVSASSSPLVPVPIRLLAVWRAWMRARRGKKPSQNQLAFEARWLDELPAAHALALRSPAAAAGVPAHTRLCNAAPGCGLPVGNLTSHFFAKVYLNALDQFLRLRDVPPLRPCHQGVDFLGYVVCTYYRRVRLRLRLHRQIFSQMPWLTPFFELNPDGSLHLNTPARWEVLRRRAVKRILKPEGDNP